MTKQTIPLLSGFLLASLVCAQATPIWTIRIEEPTGLYRRSNEVVSVPLARLGGRAPGYTILAPDGTELPWQTTSDALLFPVSVIPGDLPEYRVMPQSSADGRPFVNSILLRRIRMHRLELGNSRFRVLIDLTTPAMVETYSLTTAPHRSLNYVETTPEEKEALNADIHSATASGYPDIPGVTGPNTGWTTLGGVGPITQVDFLESGPLRGRVRLSRTNETWELTWAAGSPALRWKATKGFHFTAVSAAPYLPFDRFLGGSEYDWPTGPDSEEPPDHAIGARDWKKLPAGHGVYYRAGEDYGALGVVALDPDLNWTGIGSRRFIAEKAQGETELALTFPSWRANDTVLEARRENRVLRQPVLLVIKGPIEANPVALKPAARQVAVEAQESAPPPSAFVPDAISLDGEWELAWAEKGAGPPESGWRKVRVPGTAHVQWLDGSKIYTHEAEWISGKEWWYRRKFDVPDRFSGRRLRLQFEATDYYADAWLNGESLGRHEGYIDPYEYDVSRLARPGGENELLVRVWTPVDYYWKHRPYTVKGSYGAVDQKPDDITALGITRPVRLLASDPLVIKDLAIDTRLKEDDAEVEVELELDGAPMDSATLELTLSPRNFTSTERYRVRAPLAGLVNRIVIPVKHPQLWWTWDHGKPNLYTLEVRLLDATGRVVDGRSLAVGIREVERVGWIFYLNRRRMFIRGTNYYYHLFLSEMDRAGYERDLRLMLQMNVNMIRLHCHFTNREFYDLADEMGVLLWQDFLEAWYPHDPDFSPRAAALYDPLIRYARNHPSVASWTTSDEEDLENYRDLTKHLAPRPAFLDPQRRPVVRSTGRYGDAHVYHGWYDGSIWEYAQMTEDFVSELGATSLPNYETLIKFLPDHWPIAEHADEWMFRRLQIPEAMRAWGEPGAKTLKEYIPQTQAYVARLFQIALERMRRLKYHPAGGIFHFHAIDIWPSVTMAAIDFERVPTLTFYTVQRSFAPVAALFEYDRDRWKAGEDFTCGLWAVNDRWEPVPDATVAWEIRDEAGRVQHAGDWKLTFETDSSRKLGEVKWKPEHVGGYALHVEVRAAAGAKISENQYEFAVIPESR